MASAIMERRGEFGRLMGIGNPQRLGRSISGLRSLGSLARGPVGDVSLTRPEGGIAVHRPDPVPSHLTRHACAPV